MVVRTLAAAKGISATTVVSIPEEWSKEWFRTFISQVLANVDIRNAIPGTGVTISGTATTPATISVDDDVKSLFHEPYALAVAPSDSVLNSYRVIGAQAGVTTITDGGATHALTIGIAANGIGNAQIRQAVGTSIVGNSTAALANVADIPASVDNTVLLRAAGALNFAAVPLGALATQAGSTVVGNATGSPSAPTALTQTQLTALINSFSSSLSGAVPASGGGTANFMRADGSWAVPPGTAVVPAAANPTGAVTLAETNGTATTFMRSDAAPKIDPTIAPTWSGQHIFAEVFSTGGASGNSSILVKCSLPAIQLVNTGAAADSKTWTCFASNTDFVLRIDNDAGSAVKSVFDFTRAANVLTTMVYGNSTDNPTHTFNGALILAGQTTTTTAPAAGGAGALPATPKGYCSTTINGVVVKFPFY